MNLRNIVIRATLVVIILVVAAIAGLVWWQFIIPVYVFSQIPSADGTTMIALLTSDRARYVREPSEYGLEPDRTTLWRLRTGRTTGTLSIYPIAGNADYIYMMAEMYPIDVFRKASIPAVRLENMQISQVQLSSNMNSQSVFASTDNPEIALEVQQGLTQPGNELPATSAWHAYNLYLLSPQLPGLHYFAFAVIDPAENVYLSRSFDSQKGVKAGPLFTRWVLGHRK